MVNCPKCQFLQPKDRFCANCGLDMDNYRPKPPPLAVRLAKNWVFQLSVFVVAVIAGVILVQAKNRAHLSQSFAALEEATSTQRNFVSKKPVDKKFSQNLDHVGDQVAATAAPVEVQTPTPQAEVAPTPAVTQASESPVIATKLKLVFAEVNRGSFAALLGDSRSIASTGVYFAGLLPEREGQLDTSGFNILDSASDLRIKMNQPIVVFKGSRDPQLEQNIGLTTQITPTFVDDQGTHLQVEVKRSLRGPGGTVTEENFQEQMVLKKDSKAYLSGLLPHRVLADEEARILGTNPTILKVLASSDFQSGASEFVLFIEAK